MFRSLLLMAALTIPEVHPGTPYYIGVFAMTDANFDIRSEVGTECALDKKFQDAGSTLGWKRAGRGGFVESESGAGRTLSWGDDGASTVVLSAGE